VNPCRQTADRLEEESGIAAESSIVKTTKDAIRAGEWEKV
jgi:hypothetical protein